MPQPPNDDGFDDVLSAVNDALDKLQLNTPDTRDAIAEGLRQAMVSLQQSAPTASPGVVVLDGGKNDEPTSQPERRRPELHVAPPVSETADQDLGSDVTAEVRIYRVDGDQLIPVDGPSLTPAGLNPDGIIDVPGGDGAWQTIYRADSAHPYRLSCERGELDVAVNGVIVERLGTGPTIDISAKLLRVRSASDAPAKGRYSRL